MPSRRIVGAAAALAVAAMSIAATSRSLPGTGGDWASHGGGADEGGYSRLATIDRGNVARLGLVSHLDLPGEVALEATPLAIAGTLYFTGSWSAVYAVDARTGRLLWKHDPEVWRYPAKMKIVFPVNRGCAYADGLVFSGTLDGRLIALDARTGRQVWSVATVEPGDLRTVTGAPRTFEGKVIIGQGGGDYGQRGYVTAYDQKTGRRAWRFYTVPGSPEQNRGDPAMERAAATWSGEYWRTGTGGTAWNGITFDPELHRLYIGTGNAGPWDPAVRSPGDGDNLYLASIVALDADTGRYLWHYQVNPREAWDYKATANMVAATIPIDGRPRRVLMQAPTNGFFYVLDRDTGKLISAEKIGKANWAERIDLKTGRPVEAPGIRYDHGPVTLWPSPLGAHNWQDMAFSPRTGLVYIPTMQLGTRWSKQAGPGDIAFGGVVSTPVFADKDDGTASLLAWDPVRQRARWTVRRQLMWNGGALATAGGLVFQGGADGILSAFDAETGRSLWRFDAGLGIVSAPISYMAGGVQYVSVLVGYGGNPYGEGLIYAGWKYGRQPRRVLTFALGGKDRLPPSAPQDFTLHPIDPAGYAVKTADLAEGRRLYTWNCGICHGINVVSSGAPAPDLRESALAASEPAFRQVVLGGILARRGMPRFETLTDAEAGRIFAYIRARARDAARATGSPATRPAGDAPLATRGS